MIETLKKTETGIVGSGEHRFRLMISRETIAEQIHVLADRLRNDYHDKNPIFLGVLNGCFIFMADLIREINIPCEVDFIKLSSYANSMTSGTVNLIKDVDAHLEGRHIILVEDIVDTGKSLGFLRSHLQAMKPASLVMAAMFIKSLEKSNGIRAEYVGMEIPDEFVVGYGLDFAQQWRQLPDLYVRIED